MSFTYPQITFLSASTPQKRAHRAGTTIGYDSPEAFDEVIWRCFWSEHLGQQCFALWSTADAKDEASDFMTDIF